ncbi:MAG: type II toxin-antitoxin system VapC family toxin [Patescibacteria group bacterium]|nr:type II toxin-antitoxin system VapC family toxin [Patescibacteria group bacterium]
MNLVDSSAWLEYSAGTDNALSFTKAIYRLDTLLVPTLVIYEVFKQILAKRGENAALHTVAYMKLGNVVDLDLEISLQAAKISKEHKLPMADSIILATARKHNATIWTQDKDFKNFKKVKYFAKR